MNDEKARKKRDLLIRLLKGLDSLLVAFSGGVDSTFLVALAHEALKENLLAVTAGSIVFPSRETQRAVAWASERGIRHRVIAVSAMGLAEFVSNGPERCYHCKKHLFRELKRIASEQGIGHIAHAANTDDLKDYRPGAKATDELGILAPLLEAGLGKEEIRSLSREMGLPTWDMPSMACLATRIPYGDVITEEKLGMVESAEEYLLGLGLQQVRVRHHQGVARIEAEGPWIERLMAPELRNKVVEKLLHMGFRHVAVDMEGYVPGGMNRALKQRGNGVME